jgi:hypothetical protein
MRRRGILARDVRKASDRHGANREGNLRKTSAAFVHPARPKKNPKASCAKQTVWGFIAVDVRTLSPHANSIVRNKKPHVPRKRKS